MTDANGAHALASIDHARRLLAQAHSVADVKDLHDRAESLRVFVAKSGLGTNEQNRWAEFKLEAERHGGALLAEMPKNEGGPVRSHAATAPPPRLDEYGITKSMSSRWQLIASVPDEQFRGYIATQKRLSKEITSADVLKMAPRHVPDTAGERVTSAVVTLSAWHAMTPLEQERVIADAPRGSRAGMIAHADEDAERAIEWAIWSRNVVTGCLHDCPYCYARDIAVHRFVGYGFEPAFHPDRLHSPRNVPVPAQAASRSGHRNIFSDSMADLFGKWVPQPWIDAELAVARECSDWRFLYLTKFPQRMAQQDWPDNAWVGTSVDGQARVATAERAFHGVRAGVRWLSCEPMLERLTFRSLADFDWVVIGGATRSTQTEAFQPPAEWVEHLIAQANDAGCQVYLKRNLGYRREYPGQEEAP